MTFGTVHGNYLSLKKRLTIHIGPTALAEITVEPPRGADDELSFIRLVSWAYVLIHENGKVPLNFLKQLPPLDKFGKLLPHVRGLRTLMSHNLSFDKSADVATMQTAISWFKRTCGSGTPTNSEQWGRCFSQLCNDLSALMSGAISACDNLDSVDDGPRLVADLKTRINLQWDAYLFDSYVEKASERLGFLGIDVVTFRSSHLDSWRKVVATSEDDSRSRLVTLRVEADLLNFMAGALPFTSDELQQHLNLNGPAELAAAMLMIRVQRDKGAFDLQDLIKIVSEKIAEQSLLSE